MSSNSVRAAIFIDWHEKWVISIFSFLCLHCWVRTHLCATRNKQSCWLDFGLSWMCNVCRHCHHCLHRLVRICIPFGGKYCTRMRDNGNEFMVILSFPMANVIFCLFISCLFAFCVCCKSYFPLRVSRSHLLDSSCWQTVVVLCASVCASVFHVHRK